MHGPLDDAWRRLNRELFSALGPDRYATWIRNARPAVCDEEIFQFHVQNAFAKDKVDSLFRAAVTAAAQRVTNRNVRVRFSVEGDSFVPGHAALLRDETRAAPGGFAGFVSGPGNRLALAAARAFAGGGRGSPRSLLLHGRSGLGKTHLLRAIASELARAGTPGVLLFSGDQFRRHFDFADLRGHREAFLKKCRTASVLLFDDLDLLAPNPEAQSALADVLRALEERGARAALTGERPARALEGFSAAARRRLRIQAEVRIDRPDGQTSLGFLRAQAPPGTPPAVLEIVAEHVQSSHKDQLWCLARILERPPASAAAARAVVGEFLNQWSSGLTYQDIVRAAAESFGVAVREIYDHSRTRAAAEARHACFYLARKLLGEPFARIGDHFGGRDHATVLEACRNLKGKRGRRGERVARVERKLAAAGLTPAARGGPCSRRPSGSSRGA
jgi:chromosomal replication initiator protein